MHTVWFALLHSPWPERNTYMYSMLQRLGSLDERNPSAALTQNYAQNRPENVVYVLRASDGSKKSRNTRDDRLRSGVLYGPPSNGSPVTPLDQ